MRDVTPTLVEIAEVYDLDYFSGFDVKIWRYEVNQVAYAGVVLSSVPTLCRPAAVSLQLFLIFRTYISVEI